MWCPFGALMMLIGHLACKKPAYQILVVHFWRLGFTLNSSSSTSLVKKGASLTTAITLPILDGFAKILLLLQRTLNFQQNPCYVTHHTLSVLLHCLGKLKN